jgi:hypothetical protein
MAAHAISARTSAVHARIPRPSQPMRRRFFGAARRLALLAPVCFCDFAELDFGDFAEFKGPASKLHFNADAGCD